MIIIVCYRFFRLGFRDGRFDPGPRLLRFGYWLQPLHCRRGQLFLSLNHILWLLGHGCGQLSLTPLHQQNNTQQ